VENSKVKSATDSLKALVALVESLRGAHGCPWDKRQTPRTMLIYLIEEMYELADAIESNRAEDVQEELGDVLFHIFFMARLFQEEGQFSIYDVAREITDKMIRRHPHVFGSARADNSDTVKHNWHKIKQDEKKQGKKKSVIDSVPKKLPALMRAYQICERTARRGFDWKDAKSLLEQLESELNDLKRALKGNQEERISEEFGNLMFDLVNLARFLKFHPETALSGALKTFEKRFRQMEKRVSESGTNFDSLSQAEIQQIWQEIEPINR
jgi:tetrapyrrole methylase family protein/MazG family protein